MKKLIALLTIACMSWAGTGYLEKRGKDAVGGIVDNKAIFVYLKDNVEQFEGKERMAYLTAKNNICSSKTFREYLEMGLEIEYIYLNPKILRTFVINITNCGN